MMPNPMACIGTQWSEESMTCPYAWVLAGISRAKLPVGSGGQVLKTYTSLRFLIANIHLSLETVTYTIYF